MNPLFLRLSSHSWVNFSFSIFFATFPNLIRIVAKPLNEELTPLPPLVSPLTSPLTPPAPTVTSYSWINSKDSNDITASKSLVLKPGHRYLVPINLIMDIPEGYSVRIHPRSGMALKQGITLINCEGVIDSDYVDPTFITLYNSSDSAVTISDGDRVAQGELIKNEQYTLASITEKPAQKTSRAGGFGSTGVN